ncbi:MAG: VPLPA-CTERM sorting domain-containing protein [Pseudomonadota bacterium]
MRVLSFVTGALAALATPLSAATIDVLWTSGTFTYNNNIQNVANAAATYDPAGDGALTWNLTMWDGGAVDFTSYDVLVVGSTYGVDQNINGNGFFGLGVSAQGVLDNKAGIEAARGNRTFLSGQDADWHDLNGPRARSDGPRGFMINAVNWAASGTGLGIVSMTDRHLSGPASNRGWWNDQDSFLKDEVGTSAFAYDSEVVNIGPGQDTFPVNEGLTSRGLSNWRTSSHACFTNVATYTAINLAPFRTDTCGVTLVTAAAADGDTGGGDTPSPVPLPASAFLLIAALTGLRATRRRR